MKNKIVWPVCPYCESDDTMCNDLPSWDWSANDKHKDYIRIIANCYCMTCHKEFDVMADLIWHKSRKIRQD